MILAPGLRPIASILALVGRDFGGEVAIETAAIQSRDLERASIKKEEVCGAAELNRGPDALCR